MAKKKHSMKQPYTNWLISPNALSKVKDLIEKVGFPLEITTRNKLRSREYNVSNSYYSEIDNKSGQEALREIDIYAARTIDTIKYKGCEFTFELAIVGECKYSATNDFFGFPNDTQSIGSSFPVVYEGSNLLEVTLDANFILPSVIQNISEIDTIGLNVFTENKVLYEGCEQIFNALSYFVDIRSSHRRSEKYLEIYDELAPKFDLYREQKHPTAILTDGKTFYYDKEVIRNFVNSTFEAEELFAIIKDFTIHVAIPLIIIGPNSGLIKVDVKNEKVNDLVDMKYCAYLYAPREIKSHSRLLIKDYNFAVIVCNVDHLDDCLNDLENGVRKSVPEIMSEIENKPHLLYYEIYNNSYNARRST